MKAVLCLWAREHLKGRPGPGSGLARLLKKKRRRKTQHSLLCMCVYVCLAKSGKTGRLCPATLGRDAPRNSQSCRWWGRKRDERRVSPKLKVADLLFTCCPSCRWGPLSPSNQSCNTAVEKPGGKMKKQKRRWNIPEKIIVLKDYKGQQEGFQPTVFILCASAWPWIVTWLLKGTQRLPARICWNITTWSDTWMGLLSWILSGWIIWTAVHFCLCKPNFTNLLTWKNMTDAAGHRSPEM